MHACAYPSTFPALPRDAVFIVVSVCKRCDVTKPSIINFVDLFGCLFFPKSMFYIYNTFGKIVKLSGNSNDA